MLMFAQMPIFALHFNILKYPSNKPLSLGLCYYLLLNGFVFPPLSSYSHPLGEMKNGAYPFMKLDLKVTSLIYYRGEKLF